MGWGIPKSSASPGSRPSIPANLRRRLHRSGAQRTPSTPAPGPARLLASPPVSAPLVRRRPADLGPTPKSKAQGRRPKVQARRFVPLHSARRGPVESMSRSPSGRPTRGQRRPRIPRRRPFPPHDGPPTTCKRLPATSQPGREEPTIRAPWQQRNTSPTRPLIRRTPASEDKPVPVTARRVEPLALPHPL